MPHNLLVKLKYLYPLFKARHRTHIPFFFLSFSTLLQRCSPNYNHLHIEYSYLVSVVSSDLHKHRMRMEVFGQKGIENKQKMQKSEEILLNDCFPSGALAATWAFREISLRCAPHRTLWEGGIYLKSFSKNEFVTVCQFLGQSLSA